jgi:hypothetical protein
MGSGRMEWPAQAPDFLRLVDPLVLLPQEGAYAGPKERLCALAVGGKQESGGGLDARERRPGLVEDIRPGL